MCYILLYFVIFYFIIWSWGNCLGPGTRGLSEVHWNKNCEVVCCIDISPIGTALEIMLVSGTEGSVDAGDVRPVSVVQLNSVLCIIYHYIRSENRAQSDQGTTTAQLGSCLVKLATQHRVQNTFERKSQLIYFSLF